MSLFIFKQHKVDLVQIDPDLQQLMKEVLLLLTALYQYHHIINTTQQQVHITISLLTLSITMRLLLSHTTYMYISTEQYADCCCVRLYAYSSLFPMCPLLMGLLTISILLLPVVTCTVTSTNQCLPCDAVV